MVKHFLKDKKFESSIFFTKGEREKNGSCLTYRTPLLLFLIQETDRCSKLAIKLRPVLKVRSRLTHFSPIFIFVPPENAKSDFYFL